MENKITIKNCNNISFAEINIISDSLNILFAPNGTGKSTITKALFLNANGGDLSSLHSYGKEEDPSLISSRELKNVFVFDEGFVNTFVFQRSEVIEKSFEVFIKTPLYNERLENVDERLSTLKTDIGKNEEIISLISTLSQVSSKLQLNTNGEVKNNPFFKSLTSKDNLFRIPDSLKKYQPFLLDTNYAIEWVDWKNKGFIYDEKGDCPFCAEHLKSDYSDEKDRFIKAYKKSSVKDLKDILQYFDSLEEYISPEKFTLLNKCIKATTDVNTIKTLIKQFTTDIIYIKDAITEIINFDSYKVKSEELTELSSKLNEMKINPDIIIMFRNEKTLKLIGEINSKIDIILDEITLLKKEMGELKGIIKSLAENAKRDINGFLESAGINYELMIDVISEDDSRTVLKYIDRQNDRFDVDEIKDHLSWGERNAFALVLFMHYALSKDPNLIILDDPISSFDKDKKFAIINRLFDKGSNRSLHKRTVLLMTHDLEPIIDFIVNKQPTGGYVKADHLQNKEGVIISKQITDKDVEPQISLLVNNINNSELNIIIRLISLRKYIELTERSKEKFLAYNIISSILHLLDKPQRKINSDESIELTIEEISKGEKYIRSYIQDFSYEKILSEELTLDSLVKTYKKEPCNYFKIQLFRIILMYKDTAIDDDVLINYINKTYHIENDYLYTLDFTKFEMIPEFIINKCNEYVTAL